MLSAARSGLHILDSRKHQSKIVQQKFIYFVQSTLQSSSSSSFYICIYILNETLFRYVPAEHPNYSMERRETLHSYSFISADGPNGSLFLQNRRRFILKKVVLVTLFITKERLNRIDTFYPFTLKVKTIYR